MRTRSTVAVARPAAILALLVALTSHADALPRWVGPVPLSTENTQALLESTNGWTVWDRQDAVFYTDEKVVLWFDPSDGGSLRGIWVLEDGELLRGAATDGSTSPINLVTDKGYRLEVGDDPNWVPTLAPRVRDQPPYTEIEFASRFSIPGPTDTRIHMPASVVYRVRQDRGTVDARFEIGVAPELPPVTVAMETLASPLPEGTQDRQAHPLTGFSCAAWDSSTYTKTSLKNGRSRNAVFDALPGHFSAVLLPNDITNGRDEYRIYPSEFRDHWVGLYNGNWDEDGYKFGIDYSLVREFRKNAEFRWVSVAEDLEEESDGGPYFTLDCEIALPEPTGNNPLVWEERLFINRGDYQNFLRKTGR